MSVFGVKIKGSGRFALCVCTRLETQAYTTALPSSHLAGVLQSQ